jgi:hypothetical protein
VRIVSASFAGLSRVERQRRVYAAAADEIAAGLHALALTTLTPEEAAKKGSRFFLARIVDRFALQRGHAERHDLVSLAPQDFEFVSEEREHLTHLRDDAGFVNDEPAIVVASSSGKFQSNSRLRSRMGSQPSTL